MQPDLSSLPVPSARMLPGVSAHLQVVDLGLSLPGEEAAGLCSESDCNTLNLQRSIGKKDPIFGALAPVIRALQGFQADTTSQTPMC